MSEDYESDSIDNNKSEIKLRRRCMCSIDEEDYEDEIKQRTLLDFLIRGLGYLVYFICSIINLWFIIASTSFEVIRYIFIAPKFIQIIAGILTILLILTISLHLVILRRNSRSSTMNKHISTNKILDETVINKYTEYEKLPSNKKAEIFKTLTQEEVKLFLLLESLPPESKSLVKDLEKMGVTSTEKITQVLSSGTGSEKNKILETMSKEEREIMRKFDIQIAKYHPQHLKIKILDKRKPYSSYVSIPNNNEAIRKQFTVTVKEDNCGKIYEEMKSIEIKKNDIGKFPSLELSLEKILIDEY